MINELKIIHDFMMGVEVKGDSAIRIAESLVRLRRAIEQMEAETSSDIPSETEQCSS